MKYTKDDSIICDNEGLILADGTLVYSATDYKSNPRRHFLTPAERKLYYLLLHALPENAILAVKPRLIDFIYHSPSDTGHYSILAMHLDFVILEVPRMVALLAIELDDNSHTDRHDIDALKDEALKNNGIPLLRIKQSNFYPTEKLKIIVKEVISNASKN